MQEEETITKQTSNLIHKSIGGYGTNYYLTACGLSGGDYFVHLADDKITCPECQISNDQSK